MSFDDKVVLVTGASSGIGAAVAIKFVTEGAKVSMVGRNKAKLDKVAEKCEQCGLKPLVIVADVTLDEDIKRIVGTTIQHFDRIDVLINNAGQTAITTILDNRVMDAFDRIMSTNLRSAVYLINISAPYLIQTKGSIVNIGSVGANSILRTAGTFAYCASKAALEHFTRCIASELAPNGVRVNIINPGPVKTDLLTNIGLKDENVYQRLQKNTALDRVSEPDEIADLVLYLAGDKAKAITGASILSDNGTSLRSIPEF